MPEVEIGEVSDFFSHVVVAGITLTAPLKVGDKIHIKGHTTDQEFTVGSMQINNADVTEAKAGESVGIKIADRARRGDKVYKVTG
ncbi:MAG: translation elongation factor-like protein [Chloroflexi bacterium]|nr:translation elongation factor-like protein [Chloroflexota bacterium]